MQTKMTLQIRHEPLDSFSEGKLSQRHSSAFTRRNPSCESIVEFTQRIIHKIIKEAMNE